MSSGKRRLSSCRTTCFIFLPQCYSIQHNERLHSKHALRRAKRTALDAATLLHGQHRVFVGTLFTKGETATFSKREETAVRLALETLVVQSYRFTIDTPLHKVLDNTVCAGMTSDDAGDIVHHDILGGWCLQPFSDCRLLNRLTIRLHESDGFRQCARHVWDGVTRRNSPTAAAKELR